MAEQPVFTLHYYPFSLYSIMARFALALGEKLDPTTAPKVEIKFVDMQEQEHFSEAYLAMTPKGLLPCLSSPSLAEPIPDSREISSWLCEQQPALKPERYREAIERLMGKAYAFHAKSLTIPAADQRDGIPNVAAAMLERNNISDSHRRRLEIKSLFHDTLHASTLDPDNIEAVEVLAREFITALSAEIQLYQPGGPYLFGDQPTIIDAHATAIMARLIDMERSDLFTDPLAEEYAKGVMATKEWQDVRHGRRSIYDPSLGPVKDLRPL